MIQKEDDKVLQEKLFEKKIYIPFFLILTIIGLATAIQSQYLLYPGTRTTDFLFRFLASKLSFMWYFLPLALVLRKITAMQLSGRGGNLRWALLYFLGLFISLTIHQSLIKMIDGYLFNFFDSSIRYRVLAHFELIWIDVFGYIVLLISSFWIEYYNKVRKNEIVYADLEMKYINSKIQELRNSLQPEFLFKTLQIIADEVSHKRNAQANKILSILSDFLRITVYESDREFITLDDDIQFLGKFIEINSLHTGSNISIEKNIAPQLLGALVPGFILQPLAKYFIETADPGNLQCYILTLRISENDNFAEIQLSDNIPTQSTNAGNNKEDIFEIIGERLKQAYKDNQSFILNFSDISGRSVLIKIPINFVH